ncbi:hypothetical protein HRbin39_00795 [bacterium HR39]|nr:hypothetical protein HRbin39_00795 [bacterium HR39]
MRRLLPPAVALLVAVLAGLWLWNRTAPAPEADPAGAVTAVELGGPFELVDASGRTVTDRDFRGRWMLIFFGSTFCPDVCPTTLGTVAVALERLGPLADSVAPVFVSVDPERDTPEVVGEFVRQFDPRIVGLTGTPERIAEVAKRYRVFYRKVEPEEYGGAKGDPYLIDHSAWLYLFDPAGRFVKAFQHGVEPERLAAEIAAAMGEELPPAGS